MPSTNPARLALALLAALALTPLSPTTGAACSCAMLDHDTAVATFAASFRGRATSVVRRGDSEIVTFEVLEIFRGLEAGTRTVTVQRYADIAPCVIPAFERDVTYLVYAARNAQGLRVHYCNPSARVP